MGQFKGSGRGPRDVSVEIRRVKTTKVKPAWLTCAYLDCVKICVKGGAFPSLLNVYVCKSTGIVKSRKPLLQYN